MVLEIIFVGQNGAHSVDTRKVILMPTKPVDFTERNVRRAVRAALKEDLVVNGYEIMRNGTIRVLTAPSGQAAPSETDRDTNEWDADYGKPAA
jgi:hypothetical protein